MDFDCWKDIVAKSRLSFLEVNCNSQYQKMDANGCLAKHAAYTGTLALHTYKTELQKNGFRLSGADELYTTIQLSESSIYQNIVWANSPCRFLPK